ncbi:pentapeptide repeat-containing protein [Roseomonas sp. 18066]|uniref:pentapeptide repeat-containing protein n=1 Tax=Roseomonas sp. 18066 TaxID=2681412 RepID=UPI00135A749D|nr:pentapeptide repeat-containing protein [Roseomonas sp. 18066]
MRQVFLSGGAALRRLGLALIALVAFSGGAAACSCFQWPVRVAIAAQPVIFVGEVATEQVLQEKGRAITTTTITVTEVLKGPLPPSVALRQWSGSSGCGSYGPMPIGWKGLIYAAWSSQEEIANGTAQLGQLTTNGCRMMQASSDAASVVPRLRRLNDRRAVIEAALRSWPDSPPLLLEQARLVEQRDGHRAARPLYEALIARDPRDPAPHRALLRDWVGYRASPEFDAALARAETLLPGDAAIGRIAVQARIARGERGLSEGRRDFRDWVTWLPRLQGDLRGIDFSGAQLPDLYLRGTDLRRARFAGADIDRLNLSQADLRGTDLSGLLAFGANLNGSRLDGARLDGADLRRATFYQASLRRLAVDEARLVGAELTETDLAGARLTRSDLRRADLRGALLDRAVLHAVDLRDARLEDADLSTARIEASRFEGASYDCLTRWPPRFDPAALGARKLENPACR